MNGQTARTAMPLLKSCCICIPAKTGAFALGTAGIVASGAILAPIVIFLENHSFYITEFALTERNRGNYIDDENVPEMEYFSKVLYSAVLALDVSHIFACILLLVGLSTSRHLLLLPWLMLMGAAILILLTFAISFIISLADYSALAACLGTSPVLMVLIYCWLVVLSAFQTIRKTRRKAMTTLATTTSRRVVHHLPGSSSMFSVSSFKEGIQRVLGCTPPPPYEAVHVEGRSLKCLEPSDPESTSSQQQLLLFHSPEDSSATAEDSSVAAAITRRRSPTTETAATSVPTSHWSDVTANSPVHWSAAATTRTSASSANRIQAAMTTSQTDLRSTNYGSAAGVAAVPVVTLRKATSLFSNMNLCLPPPTPRGAGFAAATAAAAATAQLLLPSEHEPGTSVNASQDAATTGLDGEEEEEDKASTWSSSLSSMSSTSLKSPSITNIVI